MIASKTLNKFIGTVLVATLLTTVMGVQAYAQSDQPPTTEEGVTISKDFRGQQIDMEKKAKTEVEKFRLYQESAKKMEKWMRIDKGLIQLNAKSADEVGIPQEQFEQLSRSLNSLNLLILSGKFRLTGEGFKVQKVIGNQINWLDIKDWRSGAWHVVVLYDWYGYFDVMNEPATQAGILVTGFVSVAFGLVNPVAGLIAAGYPTLIGVVDSWGGFQGVQMCILWGGVPCGINPGWLGNN